MIEKTWPTLYKKNSDGSLQEWTIEVHLVPDVTGVCIIKRYGQVGGKIQVTEPDYIAGKNIGKSNETTPVEQAIKEAEAQWVKKQTGSKGYTPSAEDAEGGVRSELNSGGAAPMLAKTYGRMENGSFVSKDNKKIIWPCLGQPKLNGNRLIATLIEGKATLTSRDCKPVVTVPHIVAALEESFPGVTAVFDGEMYNHDLYEHLEDLRHMIAHGDELVQYHIYDIVDPTIPQVGRIEILEQMFKEYEVSPVLRLVETVTLVDHGDAVETFNDYRAEQYEGLILRNVGALYDIGRRSADLQKLKGWIDREFLIVDVVEKGKGKDAGKAKFVCITGDGDPVPGVEFKMDIAASQEVRSELWERRGSLVGQWLTVRFSYYTQDGKPFHGQGQQIRDVTEANIA